MGLRGLRYFLAAAEEMNFRRAAEKLYVTQQTLSVHIQNLERQYGTRFFERRPRLALTPAGEEMADYARRALRLESAFAARLADISAAATGRLRVGITGIRGTIFMPRIWGVFHAEFPNIVLSLTEAPTAALDEMLEKGLLDLYIGVGGSARPGRQIWTLSEEKICCVAAPALVDKYFRRGGVDLCAKAAREGLELSDLDGMPLIAFSRGNSLRDTLEEHCAGRGISPRVVVETSRHDLVMRFCRQGFGVGLIYQMILYDLLSSEAGGAGVRVFPMKNLTPLKHTCLVCRREDARPRFLAGFIRTAQAVFAEYAANADAVIRHAAAGKRAESIADNGAGECD